MKCWLIDGWVHTDCTKEEAIASYHEDVPYWYPTPHVKRITYTKAIRERLPMRSHPGPEFLKYVRRITK